MKQKKLPKFNLDTFDFDAWKKVTTEFENVLTMFKEREETLSLHVKKDLLRRLAYALDYDTAHNEL